MIGHNLELAPFFVIPMDRFDDLGGHGRFELGHLRRLMISLALSLMLYRRGPLLVQGHGP